MKKVLSLLLVVFMLVFTIGCSGDATSESPETTEGVNQETVASLEAGKLDYQPVKITNYDAAAEPYTQEYTEVPQRVVVMETQIAQLMLALNLDDKIVGTTISVGEVSDQYKDRFNALNLLSDDGYPSKEVVINEDPDMIIGWGSAFSDKNLGDVTEWTEKGIHTYAMENTVKSSVTGPRTVERIYIDIQNLGKIFDVEERANELIANMKARASVIYKATNPIKHEDKVRVLTVQMVYENQFFGRSSRDLTTNLIEQAGGLSLDVEFGKQSLERIIELNPDVILVINRTDKTADSKIKALKENEALKNVNAIKNNRFVTVEYTDFYGGSYETIEIIEMMAKAFYPKEMKDLDISKATTKETQYPVMITNYDGYVESNKGAVVEQEFTKAPERVFVMSQAVAENMIALGLEDRIIATAHMKSPVYPPFADKYNALEFIGDGGYPSKEVIVNLNPDMIMGFGSVFADKCMGSVVDLHAKGINTYVMQNTTFGLGNRNVYWILNDIKNLGVIFNVQERADELIASINARIQKAEDNVKDIKEEDKPTVHTVQFVYENEYSPRNAADLTADIIRLAGGRCIDGDSGKQSIENLIEKNPDIILVVNMTKSPADEAIKAIKDNPSLQGLTAVKNDAFIKIEHTAFYCGSLQTIDAIEDLNVLISEMK